MKLNDYQKEATKFAGYSNMNYPYFALVEEVGEFCGKIAKNMRGDRSLEDTHALMKKEAGDILWNLSEICSINGWSLEDIAKENLAKLSSRKERDVIKGDGDVR
jgi:NTP pyrophosphatase (non-canonical NTP hydrolase)